MSILEHFQPLKYLFKYCLSSWSLFFPLPYSLFEIYWNLTFFPTCILTFHILNISLCASFCIISSHLHITLIFFRCLICFKSIFFYYYYFLIFKSFSVFYKISVLLSRALGVLILCYFCWSFLKVILSPCAFYNFGLRVNVCLALFWEFCSWLDWRSVPSERHFVCFCWSQGLTQDSDYFYIMCIVGGTSVLLCNWSLNPKSN